MKKGITKSLYSFGTAVLAFGTLASAGMPIVSATTVSSSQTESTQAVVSTSKKSQDSISSAKQSSRILTSIASHQGAKSSINNVETQASTRNAKAAQSSATRSSIMRMRLDATKGSYMITGTMPNTSHPQDGWEANGPDRNGEVVYCYDPDNWNPSANNDGNGNPVDPNAPLNNVSYNRSNLWNGSEANGYNPASVDKVAAVLYAGYPNNIGGKQHNGPISQSQVDQWYKQYCANHQMSTDPSASNYFSEAQYEYDMTQNAIWGVEGNVPGDNVPSSSFGNAYKDDPLSEALYNYATQHPLDAKNAAQNGVTLENAQGQPMSASDTLTVDPKTHESEGFQIKGGDVTLPTSTNGYHVVNAQGQTVTTLEPGETYHVVFSPSTDPTKVNMMCPYLHVATADYYHSNDPEATLDNGGKKPWQNMVGLTTNTASIAINFKMASESSSISSAKSSSAVKSSSKKSSSSSVKSSSVVTSSKKSSAVSSKSAKNSSVATSSKKATVTSSSNTAKKSAVTSSSVVSTKNSTKKASSSETAKATTSSSNNTTSAKKAVVTGVNHGSNSGKGTGHGQGKGEGHGMPQTGEAVATSLVVAGVVLLATAGAITLRKRN